VQLDEDPATGHWLGHSASLPVTWSPRLSVLVLHQAVALSSVVQLVYTTPLYLKGKTHWPLAVVQGARLRLSLEQAVSQSPQLLVMTLLAESTAVAHQGMGESV